MQTFKKNFLRFLITALSMLLILGLYSGTAVAGSPDSLEITGDGVTTPKTFTIDQLQAMEQHEQVYSAINTWPTKKWYVGKGVLLRDLLDSVGIKEEAQLVKFTSSDSYAITLTVKELLKDERYLFPHFKESLEGKDGDGNIPGSSDDRQKVEPIIALKSVEGSNNPDYMNDLNIPLLMMGQRAVTEQNGNLFVKYLAKIEVLTTEPQKWDIPQANPPSGEVSPGTMVALSNAHMDDDKVYYTTDGSTPTLDSPMYNWIARRWWSARADVLGNYNKPIGPINKSTTIKAITIGPGKLDSDVVTFSYTIGENSPAKSDSETAVDMPPQPEENPVQTGNTINLNDIKNHWAQENIEQSVARGIVGGYPDGSFKPDNIVTRAEFVTMLVKAFGLDNSGGKIFTDTAGHWAKDYITKATANGIVSGFDAATFGPNNQISREQMAVMITNAAKLTGAADELQFIDNNSISGWSQDAIASAIKNGVMKGCPGNKFNPQGGATRAEAVTVIINALNMHL
ncbi:MAG: S-layer homology domain-containing protein [Syntrophomonas sp.]